MLKNAAIGFMLVVLIFLGLELRSLWADKSSMQARYNDAQRQFESASVERDQLQAEIDSMGIPDNLGKELRDRFHYQAPDEKVLILVPRASTTASSSQ